LCLFETCSEIMQPRRFLWTQTINQLKHARPPYNETLLRRHCHSPVRSFVSARLLLTKKRNTETSSVISANSHSMPLVLARLLQNSSPVVRATKNTPPRAQLASATALMAKTVSSPIGISSSIGALAMFAKLGSMKTVSRLKKRSSDCQTKKKLALCVRNARKQTWKSSTEQWRFRSFNWRSRFTPSSKTRDTLGH